MNERTTWLKTRNRLSSYDYSDDWEKVIQLFMQRIENKFFSPIEILLKHRNGDGTGFSIVSIQCLLIELFATFRTGLIHNPRFNENSDPSYQFKDCLNVYVDFLQSEDCFKDHFFKISESGKKELDTPFKAIDFYTDVRCGLLHEGKTKKKWTINLKPKNESNDFFIKETDGKIKIYRTLLHYRLRKYLNDYVTELKDSIDDSKMLRRNFARKMDNLYGFKPNKNKFEWWNY
jgi:hypothetical protein